MILGVPTSAEFTNAGADYLCLAWIDLMHLLDAADSYGELREHAEEGDDIVESHWKTAYHRLASCASLIHQGAEFLLKARIVAVSPFILLDSAGAWPRLAANTDTDFTKFKTIDARLLVQVHDTVCDTRLPDAFKQFFDGLRVRRNALTHGIPSSLRLAAIDLIKEILKVATVMLGPAYWPKLRREHELHQPATWSDYHGAIPRMLMDELERSLGFLSREEAQCYLGICRDAPRYICPECHSIDLQPDPPVRLAILEADGSGVCCVACGAATLCSRESCAECNAALRSEDGMCLSCGHCN